jgi:predicted dehydrogenase
LAKSSVSKLNVGVIGYRNHAERLIEIIDQSNLGVVKTVFHPSERPDKPYITNNFDELLKQDAVVIASPNATHYEYLVRLANDFEGYVLCEKPPVSSIEQLEALTLDPGRFLFNFNYRYSRLTRIISESIEDGRLGVPVHMNAIMCQGLAFKEGYADSWRADAGQHMHGVTETKAIHYVDMARVLFGNIAKYEYSPSRVSGHGTAFDTCHLAIAHDSGVTTSLFMSYAAPLVTQVTVVGTNGVIEFHDNSITISTPRDTFDKRGFFATPPKTTLKDYQGERADMYYESLENSVTHFLSHCRTNKPFATSEFHASLETNRFILELLN